MKSNAKGSFQAIFTNGDVPTPRMGHKALTYKKYMYIFGGKSKDYKEHHTF